MQHALHRGIVTWLQQVERAAVVEGRHLGVARGHPGVEAGEQIEASGGEEDYVDAVAGDVVLQLRRRQVATGDAHRRRIHELGRHVTVGQRRYILVVGENNLVGRADALQRNRHKD